MKNNNQRLEAGGYREMHWHTSGEWAYVISGSARIQAINENGESFIGMSPFFPRATAKRIRKLTDHPKTDDVTKGGALPLPPQQRYVGAEGVGE